MLKTCRRNLSTYNSARNILKIDDNIFSFNVI
jgi:hypothetical protein